MKTTETAAQGYKWNVYYRTAPRQPESVMTVQAWTKANAERKAERRMADWAHYGAFITRVEAK